MSCKTHSRDHFHLWNIQVLNTDYQQPPLKFKFRSFGQIGRNFREFFFALTCCPIIYFFLPQVAVYLNAAFASTSFVLERTLWDKWGFSESMTEVSDTSNPRPLWVLELRSKIICPPYRSDLIIICSGSVYLRGTTWRSDQDVGSRTCRGTLSNVVKLLHCWGIITLVLVLICSIYSCK